MLRLAMPVVVAAPTWLESAMPSTTAIPPLLATRYFAEATDFDGQSMLPDDMGSPTWDSAAPWMDWLGEIRSSITSDVWSQSLVTGSQCRNQQPVRDRVADSLFCQNAEDLRDTPACQAAMPVSASQAAVDQATLDQCFSPMNIVDLIVEEE
jgi:hypothetical protein